MSAHAPHAARKNFLLNAAPATRSTSAAVLPFPGGASPIRSDGGAAYRGRVKYDEKTARQYQLRNERRHQAEMRMIARVFARVPTSHRVLDTPCGGGRVTACLALQGYSMHAADLSDAMIDIARGKLAELELDCPVHKEDIEALSFTNGEFDTSICFRLFHHFPTPAVRQRAVAELCRVSRQYVALSYFSPASVTSVKRVLRVALGGKRSEKHATPLREVERYFADCGFRLVKDVAQLPLIHTMHLALFERIA